MMLCRRCLLLVVVPFVLAGFAKDTSQARTSALPAPVLTSPPDGALLADFAPLLKWQNPSQVTQYRIQVAPASFDGPGLDLHRGMVESAFPVPPPPQWYGLLPDMTYTWKVRVADAPAYVSLDHPSWSPWSEKRTFRTPRVSSATIDVVNPLPDATTNTLHPILQWRDKDPNTWYYEVQVSKAQDFGTDAFRYHELRHGGVTAPARSYAIPTNFPLEDGTTYYWRVRPRSQGDAAPLEWSQTFSFRTAATTAPAWQDGRFWQYRLTYQDRVAKATYLVLGKVTMEGETVYLVLSRLSTEDGQPLGAEVLYFSAQDFRTLMELDAGFMAVGRMLAFPMSAGQRFVWAFGPDGQARYARIAASEQVQVQGAAYDAFKVQPEDAPDGTMAWWYAPQVQFIVRQDAGGGASSELEASGVLGGEAGLDSAFGVLGAMATSTERAVRYSSVTPTLEVSRHFRRASGTDLLKVLSQDQDAAIRAKAAAALAVLAGERTTAQAPLDPGSGSGREERLHVAPVVAFLGEQVAGALVTWALGALWDKTWSWTEIKEPKTITPLPPVDLGDIVRMPLEVDYAVGWPHALGLWPWSNIHDFVHYLDMEIGGGKVASEVRPSGQVRGTFDRDPAGIDMKQALLPAILIANWSCKGENKASLTVKAWTVERIFTIWGPLSAEIARDESKVDFEVSTPFFMADNSVLIDPATHYHDSDLAVKADVTVEKKDGIPGTMGVRDWYKWTLDGDHADGIFEIVVSGGSHHGIADSRHQDTFRVGFNTVLTTYIPHIGAKDANDHHKNVTAEESFTVWGKVSGKREHKQWKTPIPWEGDIDGDANCRRTVTKAAYDADPHPTATPPGIPGPTSTPTPTPTATPIPAISVPRVSITEPLNGAAFASGAAVRFAGTAVDAEGRDLTAGLTWVSSIDGTIGRGGSFSAILSAGSHIITASVTDAGGRTGSASIAVSVAPPASTPTATSTPTPTPVLG